MARKQANQNMNQACDVLLRGWYFVCTAVEICNEIFEGDWMADQRRRERDGYLRVAVGSKYASRVESVLEVG